jgi:hypothetical protein
MKGKIMKTITIASAVLIAGCSSQSAMLRNDAGHVVQCANWGIGVLGVPAAMAMQADCVKKAKAAGYWVLQPGEDVPPQPTALEVKSVIDPKKAE